MFGGIKPKYTEVPKDETISIDNESDSWSQESPKIRQMPHFLGIGPVSWSLLSAFLLLLLVYQEYYYRGRYWKGAYDTGFHTEYGPSRTAIELVEVQFSGTMAYDDTGHLFIDLGKDGVKYFGQPSPEIDQAWEDLIGYIYIDGQEIDAAGKAEPTKVISLDVQHTLHCVNQVRKILDSSYYYNSTLENLTRGRRIHIDHCLNHIRQSIQCTGDLTPVTALWFEDQQTEVGDFDQQHTCRDLSKIKEWTASHAALGIPGPNARPKGYRRNEEWLKPWNDLRNREFE